MICCKPGVAGMLSPLFQCTSLLMVLLLREEGEVEDEDEDDEDEDK